MIYQGVFLIRFVYKLCLDCLEYIVLFAEFVMWENFLNVFEIVEKKKFLYRNCSFFSMKIF